MLPSQLGHGDKDLPNGLFVLIAPFRFYSGFCILTVRKALREVNLTGLVVDDEIGHRTGWKRKEELVESKSDGHVIRQPIRAASDLP